MPATWHAFCIALGEDQIQATMTTMTIRYTEELTPEIERKLAVEELWARRHVLAELMNAERLKVYLQRRALFTPPAFERLDAMWSDTRSPAPDCL